MPFQNFFSEPWGLRVLGQNFPVCLYFIQTTFPKNTDKIQKQQQRKQMKQNNL